MLEARIVKAAVVTDPKKGGTILVGVAEYYDVRVNFKVAYDWSTLAHEGFLDDLRDKLAEDFDLPLHRIDLRHEKLLKKMKDGYEVFQNHNIIH